MRLGGALVLVAAVLGAFAERPAAADYYWQRVLADQQRRALANATNAPFAESPGDGWNPAYLPHRAYWDALRLGDDHTSRNAARGAVRAGGGRRLAPLALAYRRPLPRPAGPAQRRVRPRAENILERLAATRPLLSQKLGLAPALKVAESTPTPSPPAYP